MINRIAEDEGCVDIRMLFAFYVFRRAMDWLRLLDIPTHALSMDNGIISDELRRIGDAQ